VAGRRAVGLDIGTSAVRAAELSVGRGGYTLERFGQVALPVGAVIDGEVLDREAVTAALKVLWSQTKFSTKRVVLGVANQKVVVRQVDLPWMEPKELRNALAFQVQDFIPIPVDQAIMDFHPLEEFTNDAGNRMLRVLLVAAGREMVGSCLDAVQHAGLTPVMVDLTSFALIRSSTHADALGIDTQAEALIDIGARVTNIAVHQGGQPKFVRVLLMGGADITEAVADPDHSVTILWSDGVRGVVDFLPIIDRGGWFTPLRDGDYFAATMVLLPGGAGLTWPEEIDYSADFLRQVAFPAGARG